MTPSHILPKDEYPWSEWPMRMCNCLWRAGHRQPDLFGVTPDGEFRKVEGIGPGSVAKIRELYPNELVPEGPPQLVKPSHGHGRLATKGYAGNVGSSRRPAAPSEVRALAREFFAKHIHTLNDIADGKIRFKLGFACEACGHEPDEQPTFEGIVQQVKGGPDPTEQIKAIDTLGKYGLGSAKGVDKRTLSGLFSDLASTTSRFLQAQFGAEDGAKAWDTLQLRWGEIVKQHSRSLQGLE